MALAKGTRKESVSDRAAVLSRRALGVSLVALGVLGLISLGGDSPGVVGGLFARVLRLSWGRGSWIFLAGVALRGAAFALRPSRPTFRWECAYWFSLAALCAALFHLSIRAGKELEASALGYGGGYAGGLLVMVLRRSFGEVGLYVALAALWTIAILAGFAVEAVPVTFRSAVALIRRRASRPKPAEPLEPDEPEDEPPGQDLEWEPDEQRRAPSVPTRAPAPGGRIGRGEPVGMPLEAEPRPAFGNLGKSYELPGIDLFKKPAADAKRKPERNLKSLAKQLEGALESFGVSVKVVGISQGPAVTRFEAHPGHGVKVSQVVRLADDIALCLAAPQVRVEAPIPGKSAIGIEVPNKEVGVVNLREVLESPEFLDSPSALSVAVGMDISGRPIVAGLDRMVHLLIAGATGSGKSVCVNSLIASLLFRCPPDQVKFIMIDPKVVELSVYNGIPHLLAPVVTDPKKAAGCLRWVVKEMMRRYELFADASVKDILTYNKYVEDMEGRLPEGVEMLPYIVVVIDELADLMMVAPVEVEDCIFRLAQMARAAGIHLMVATQRPSTDVITGTIKANIPSRIAFAVSSHIDSRTIIDAVGAEKLIGRGDMLFSPVWTTKPVRAQGCFVSESEIERLVRFVSSQAAPQYVDDMLRFDEDSASREDQDAQGDELFPKAVKVIVEHGQASVSLLQRKLRIGYTRAARLVDAMQERGFVGAYDGLRPREVLLSLEEYNRLFGEQQSKPKG